MDASYEEGADRMRAAIERGVRDPGGFRAALLDVPASDRDVWLGRVLGARLVLPRMACVAVYRSSDPLRT